MKITKSYLQGTNYVVMTFFAVKYFYDTNMLVTISLYYKIFFVHFQKKLHLAGLEPTTMRLAVSRSTTELSCQVIWKWLILFNIYSIYNLSFLLYIKYKEKHVKVDNIPVDVEIFIFLWMKFNIWNSISKKFQRKCALQRQNTN